MRKKERKKVIERDRGRVIVREKYEGERAREK